MGNALDKAMETKTLTEIVELPPSALQGLAESADAKLAKIHIHTIRDLGEWKYYKIAKAVAALAPIEEAGKRDLNGNANINSAFVKEWETKSLNEILDAPLSAFQGLASWVDDEVHSFRPSIRTIADLANWRYCQWAEAFAILAEYETSDHSSR